VIDLADVITKARQILSAYSDESIHVAVEVWDHGKGPDVSFTVSTVIGGVCTGAHFKKSFDEALDVFARELDKRFNPPAPVSDLRVSLPGADGGVVERLAAAQDGSTIRPTQPPRSSEPPPPPPARQDPGHPVRF